MVLTVVVDVVFSDVVVECSAVDVELSDVDVVVTVVFSGNMIFSSSKGVVESSVGRFLDKSPGVEVVLPMFVSSW